MTDTRARQAAAGPDVVAKLRDASVTAAARGRDELDAEVYHACMDAAAAIEARDAEIARLTALVERVQLCVAEFYHRWHEDARAALAPPPASDGCEA